MRPTLLAVTGPTATGKTDLAIALAQRFNTSVINCDSRQFYKEMTIGTAKPTALQLQAAPHYFIDFLSVTEPYTAGDFEKQSLALAEKLFSQNPIVIACGGSGLFVKALCEGLGDAPEADAAVREKWQTLLEQRGISYLQEEVKKRDPEWYAQADAQNPRRLQRALEIMDITGNTITTHQNKPKAERPFDTIYIGLTDKKRDSLYNRINKRVDAMIEAGLEDEVKGLLQYKDYPAFNTIGYREWLPYFEHKELISTVIEAIKQDTRHFAKRQLTWFNKVPGMHWFEHRDAESIIHYIQGVLGI